MAKGPLFLGPISGKVGNVVAYHIKYSADKETQAVRAYVSDVANPKTEPQAIQRLKLAPAVNFYRMLSRILDNAWQGQQYGNRSRQHFMSRSMTQTTGIPFLRKGEKRFFPGEYVVAEGSLVRQSVVDIQADTLTTSLITPGTSGTWGEFSQGLINGNFGVQDGDKLTFIFVGTSDLGDFVPVYSYVVLDVSSAETAASVISSSNLVFGGLANSPLTVGVTNAVGDLVAGAVIISRLDLSSGKNGSWLRSNAVMYCTDDYKETYMGIPAYEAAIATYMESKNYSSMWYLNAGISGVYVSPGIQGNSGSNIHVTELTLGYITEESNNLYVSIATMSDGTKRAYRSNQNPSRLAYYKDGYFKIQSNFLYEATAERLTAIQAKYPGVTGWIIVDVSQSSGDTPIEDPE